MAGADGRLPPGCVCCSQSLTELRDAIYCLSDVNAEAVEKQVCVLGLRAGSAAGWEVLD